MNTNKNYYLQKFSSITQGRLAVYIDAANLEKSVQSLFVHPKDIPADKSSIDPESLGWFVDYRNLMKFFKNYNLQYIHFYTARFNTESHDSFLAKLKRLGYRLSTKPLKLFADHSDDHPHRKANFDVEIGIDAFESSEQYDTIVLFSGDSDFVYLAERLKKIGKTILLFSRKGHVAKELFFVIDGYFDIVDFRFSFLRIAQKKPKIPRERDSAVDDSLSTAKE